GQLPFGGVIVNKVHHDYLRRAEEENGFDSELTLDRLAGDLERSLDGSRQAAELAAKVHDNFERYRALALRDREGIAQLTRRLDGGVPLPRRWAARLSTAGHRVAPDDELGLRRVGIRVRRHRCGYLVPALERRRPAPSLRGRGLIRLGHGLRVDAWSRFRLQA